MLSRLEKQILLFITVVFAIGIISETNRPIKYLTRTNVTCGCKLGYKSKPLRDCKEVLSKTTKKPVLVHVLRCKQVKYSQQD